MRSSRRTSFVKVIDHFFSSVQLNRHLVYIVVVNIEGPGFQREIWLNNGNSPVPLSVDKRSDGSNVYTASLTQLVPKAIAADSPLKGASVIP